jgi:hypothetical protein
MAWFRKRRERATALDSIQLRLGRYTDAYKSATQLRAWERAIRYFAEGQSLKSFQHFLFYLHDPLEQNIHWITDREGQFSFELYQGSRRISGQLGMPDCEVRTAIGQGGDLPEGLFEDLLGANYRLRYCSYGLEEDGRVILRFRCPATEADPYRLYASLRELALEADDSDDHLAAIYPALQALREPHIREKNPEEIALRITWLRQQLGDLFRWYQDDLDIHRTYPGGFSLALLATLYRIEFLLSPQGLIRSTIAGLHREYLAHRGSDPAVTMDGWMARLEDLLRLPEDQLGAEFYDVTATFGQVETLSARRLREILQGQIREMDTWIAAGLQDYARQIPGFIMGYCLYRYALPGLLRDIFALYFLATEPEWAEGLGYPVLTRRKGGFDKKALVRILSGVQTEWSDRIRAHAFKPELMDTRDALHLGRSWLDMVAQARFVGQ